MEVDAITARWVEMSKESKSENEHIPRYIKNQPWFYRDAAKDERLQGGDDYLVHHRQLKKGGALDIDNNSEPKLGLGIRDEFESVQVKRTVRLGADRCENCGSVGHGRRDCLERARKVVKSGVDGGTIAVRKDGPGSLDWDARKDRWFGYTGKEYDEVLKKWENRQEAAQQDDEEWWDTDEEVELMKLGLYKDQGGVLKVEDGSGNTKLQRASVRLREDRAAYLNDLNADEIKYDPKSRLYKSESLGSVDEESKMFRRHLTGEGKALDELNRFTRAHARKQGIRDEIESEDKVQHVLIANPTKYERMLKQEQRKEPQRVGKITDLEARRSSGTAQSAKTKRDLQDLYG